MPREFKEDVLKVVGAIDSVQLRVVENSRGRFLDIREWIISDNYTGWSKKGVRFRADEAPTLLHYIGDACKVIDEAEAA